jgi:soluble lytic murein transglycosylase-like protein
VPASGYKVEQALLFAIMRQESKFNPNAAGSGGARGLMQLMPATAHAMARSIKLSGSIASPAVNMALGQQYLQSLMDTDSVGNNLVFLLVAYNAGPVVLEKWQDTIAYNQDPLLFIESIPYGVTRDYVVNVIGNYWVYSELFGNNNPSLAMVAKGGWPLYAGMVKEQVASAKNIAGMN